MRDIGSAMTTMRQAAAQQQHELASSKATIKHKPGRRASAAAETAHTGFMSCIDALVAALRLRAPFGRKRHAAVEQNARLFSRETPAPLAAIFSLGRHAREGLRRCQAAEPPAHRPLTLAYVFLTIPSDAFHLYL